MGADIHSMAEIDWLYNGGWEAVTDALWPYPYFRQDEPVGYWNVPYHNQPLRNRNYQLFGVLAGVRNYNDLPVLFAPRGVPENASSEWKTEVEKWGPDFHSHTWLTFDELALLPVALKDTLAKLEYGDQISDDIEIALSPLRKVAEKYPVRFVIAFDN